MKAIETIITVNPDHSATFQFPEDVLPGTHTAVILVDQENSPQQNRPLHWPSRDVGPWPANLSLPREEMFGDDGR